MDEKSVLSKGGMSSKLKAAKYVVESGAMAVIADGRSQNVLSRILAGEDTGTVILSNLK
jgi:glutamate 5-kinase